VEAHHQIHDLVEQIEHEIAPPDVRELVRQSGRKIIVCKVAGKKALWQKKDGSSKAYCRGTGDLGRTKHGHSGKRKCPKAPFRDFRKRCRQFSFVGTLPNAICAIDHP
jgi:hypothetical protein